MWAFGPIRTNMITYNITGIRGDTIFSPEWLITNEELFENITYAQLTNGLANGMYTLLDLSQYSIRGHLRSSYTSEIMMELPLDIVDNRISFVLHYSDTEMLENKNTQMIYDIEFTHIADDVRTTWISGSLSIKQDITYDAAALRK